MVTINRKMKKIAKGLYYQPEDSDASLKFRFIDLKKSDNNQAITLERLIFIIKTIPINAKIEVFTSDEFFKEMDTEEEKLLKADLEKYLTDIKVFIINKVVVYIIGVTKTGNWIGVTTDE